MKLCYDGQVLQVQQRKAEEEARSNPSFARNMNKVPTTPHCKGDVSGAWRGSEKEVG